MDEISKRRVHIISWLHGKLCSVLFRGAYIVSAQLLASSRVQNLPAQLSHRTRLRHFEENQSELHNFGV